MATDVTSVINAYNQVARIATGGVDTTRPNTEAESFSAMLNKTLDGSMKALKKGEQAAIGNMTGEVSLEDLTAAISNADLTLRTAVAIRDRLVTAFQDIIKMPI